MDAMTFEHFIVASSSQALNNKEQSMADCYMEALHFHRRDIYDALMEYSAPLPNNATHNPNLWASEDNMPSFLIFVASRWE